jgi:hypothetical protein
MRYKPFYQGNKVVLIADHEGIPSGTVGTVVSKWAGTAYVVRISDGSFRWLSGSEFSSQDPNRNFRLEEGDYGIVTSDHHNHDFAKVGDSFEVFKVAHDMDHYGVLINNEVKWIGGFVLASYR